MRHVIDILRERHLFENQTAEGVYACFAQPSTVYAGFDPTSDSLQAGNFVTIMALCHFQQCGHRVVAVVGGATGMIGDPSGKTSERLLLTEADVERNLEGIRENLSRFLDFDHPTAPACLINNMDWHRDFTFVTFLRDVGRHFRLGTMLGRDTVRSRMQGDAGMSFTEFSYPLLQAFDFLHLSDSRDCRLQIGGSDQWGNITAGVDLVRRLRGREVFGLTFPLVCDNAGRKFGKSEGNAIYLDARRTSCFAFYQFFLRTDDADVIRYLRIFTFLNSKTIDELAYQTDQEPEKREAQRILAETVTRHVHGKDGVAAAQRASRVLFGAEMTGLSAVVLGEIFADVPTAVLMRDRVLNSAIWAIAADAGLCASRGEGRRLMQNGGLYLNNIRQMDPNRVITPEDLVENQLLVLRSGRKSHRLVRVLDGNAV